MRTFEKRICLRETYDERNNIYHDHYKPEELFLVFCYHNINALSSAKITFNLSESFYSLDCVRNFPYIMVVFAAYCEKPKQYDTNKYAESYTTTMSFLKILQVYAPFSKNL